MSHLRVFACYVTLMAFSAFTRAEETPEAAEIQKLESWTASQREDFNALDKNEQQFVIKLLKQDWPPFEPSDDSVFILEYSIKVDQIVSDTAFIGKMNGDAVWIEGVDTTGFADDEAVSCRNIGFMSTGNQRYETVIGGTKTVRKYEVFNSGKSMALVQGILSERGLRLFRLPKNVSDPWVIAELQTVTKSSASITPIDGKRAIRLDGSSFSDADQEWLGDKEKYSDLKAKRKAFEAARKQ